MIVDDVLLEAAADQQHIQLEVVKLPKAKRGFVLLPRRWVVERSFGWLLPTGPRLRAIVQNLGRIAFHRVHITDAHKAHGK